jgi:hypothetical protein
LRCDSIEFRSNFYRTPADPLYNPIGSHPDRIDPDTKPKVVYTVAMRYYIIPVRLLYNPSGSVM